MTNSKAFNLFLENTEVTLVGFNLMPEQYLGPNWQAVLDGWKFIESLDGEQRNIVFRRFDKWPFEEQGDRINFLIDKVKDIIGEKNYINVFCSCEFPIGAIYELIAMHNLIEDGYQFHYLKLLEDL